jgi:hypothetical protein
METQLAELFTTFMLFAWVSSSNCANIYNHALSKLDVHSDSRLLNSTQVWRAFVMNALVREGAERDEPLFLAVTGSQDDRLKAAMSRRSLRIVLRRSLVVFLVLSYQDLVMTKCGRYLRSSENRLNKSSLSYQWRV